MAIRQQRLHSVYFELLKGLHSLDINFEPHNVTAIFGSNGSGKSTIIHALIALYKPGDQDPHRRNFRFSEFFMPTSHTKWIGSSFTSKYTQKEDETLFEDVQKSYSKQDRWRPYYERRPERNVYFIGVDSCVPAIELEKRDIMIRFNDRRLEDALSATIKDKAGYVMNRNYDSYGELKSSLNRRKYIGLTYAGLNYSSLSMGAGEQRIFKILDIVFRALPYSLIVIDELDLTLHTDALNRIIEVIVRRAQKKHLQIVFTSHREELTSRTDINIRHIHQTNERTLCLEDTNPDCIARLTGIQQRPIEIFVEDKLAEVIVRKITEELHLAKYCSIKCYGAASCSFTLGTGIFLKGDNLDNLTIVLDGDVYPTEEEKITQINRYFSGNEAGAEERRQTVLNCIRQFNLPAGESPEQFINNALQQFNDNSEVCNAAIDIQAVLDKHQYVTKILQILGYEDKTQGLIKVVDKLSATGVWMDYTSPIREWIQERAAALHL